MRSTSDRLKWDISWPNSDTMTPEAARHVTHDHWVRAVAYLLLGIAIPRFALLFDKIAWRDPDYWIGSGWFLLAAAVIWESNRAVALLLRAHLDWLRQPWLKLLILLGANFACTVPLTFGAVRLWLWHIHSPFPAFDLLTTISTITTNNTVTVLFLLHAYETLYLLREQRGDRRRLEQLDRARLQAELEAMKSQLAPHFLFNCLNTLSALIERDPRTAAEFNTHLADVSRYLLAQKHRELVPLVEELAFLRSYVRLMELRFPQSLHVTLPELPAAAGDRLLVPPASLQLLVENAIKHNRHSEAEPLAIDVRFVGDSVVITNALRPKASLRPGTGTGLANLRDRVALLTAAQLEAGAAGGMFRVTLPLARD